MIVVNAIVATPLQDVGSHRYFSIVKNEQKFKICINANGDPKALDKAKSLKIADIVTVEVRDVNWRVGDFLGTKYFLIEFL